MTGLVEMCFLRISIDRAGDVNGDGIDDLIVGARFVNVSGMTAAGASNFAFGADQPRPAKVDFSQLDGNNLFALNGRDEDG